MGHENKNSRKQLPSMEEQQKSPIKYFLKCILISQQYDK